ncbi:diguanylate cyclase [Bacillus sp. ISL-41]|uniref:GGDEF domain-containing protein n=1 Tax=Bacillus sp. ISL-41 TaxID=2819127 RepID=UPI001BE53691|nr:GGDEF domain-containing protein [Bacillus sp. ISL-41]MBT2643552.1 diguanylate cyclase [Bacillus sp. ISL-41]
MGKFGSLKDFKRTVYLSMIIPSLLAMISYMLFVFNQPGHGKYLILTVVLTCWFTISLILLYHKRLMPLVEYGTLIIISAMHIGTVYDGFFNYIATDKAGAFGVTVMWVPAVILSFFLILGARRGLVFSLSVFLVIFVMGLMNFPEMSEDYLISVIQFYVAYLFYILIIYYSRFLIKLFSDFENMKENAYTDALTGIANRHQIDIWLDEKVPGTKEAPVSILFFDIDHFKAVNDTYGHKVGDSVLKELAGLVKQNLTPNEQFGRWGGEEFIIISSQSGENALMLAEELRLKINDYPFKTAGRQTVSFGVTEFRAGESVDTLISRADRGLYQSKHEGRNRVTMI